MHPRVEGVEVRPPYGLRLTVEWNRRWQAVAPGGRRYRFRAPARPAFFAQVYVDEEAGTIAWPNDVDLDPDTLYELAHRAQEEDAGNRS